MDTAEYQNIFQHETTHFVYVATHEIILAFLKKYLPASPELQRGEPARRGLKLLDAGCGTGGLTQKLKAFGTVWGLDVSPQALDFAKRRGIRHLVRGVVTKLPFPNQTFDVLICVDVLYHASIKSDMIALKEFFRVLKPGGIAVVKVPAHEFLRRHHDIMAHTRHRYSAKELKNKLEKSGFTVLKATHAFSLLLPVLLVKVFIAERLFHIYSRSDITDLPGWLNAACLFIQRLENQLIQHVALPWGASVFAVAKKI